MVRRRTRGISSLSDDERNDIESARRAAAGVPEPPPPTDLNFAEDDEDAVHREISEFMSYSENAELARGPQALRDVLGAWDQESWAGADGEMREEIITALLDALERVSPVERRKSGEALLYLVHGVPDEVPDKVPDKVPDEVDSVADQMASAAANSKSIYRLGGLGHVVNALMVATRAHTRAMAVANIQAAQSDAPEGTPPPPPVPELAPPVDNGIEADYDMRLFLNVLHSLVQHNKDDPEFCAHLASPVFDGKPLAIVLFGLVSVFNDALGRLYPIKKILVLLWKTLLVTLGGSSVAAANYEAKAAKAGVSATASIDPALLEEFDESVASRFRWLSPEWARGIPPAHAEAAELLESATALSMADVERSDVDLGPDPKSEAAIPPPPADFVPRSTAAAASVMEELYRELLPNMSRYVIILLKIILAAAPTVKNYAGTICLTSELTPPPQDSSTSIMASVTAQMDTTRHKEIIIKAVSYIFRLLLDHAAASHVYQFEYIALLLVDANCILLLLKFLNQDINEFITTRNDVPDLEFVAAPEPDDPTDPAAVSWRNFASSLNFLHILEALTYKNPVRIRQLVRYKAPAILKRNLKIRHTPIKVVTLKLLKRQIKFLGKKWRNSNTKVITLIYTHLEPDLDTSWLYPDSGMSTAGIALGAPWTLSVGMPPKEFVTAAAAAAAAGVSSDSPAAPFQASSDAQSMQNAAAADQDRDFALRKAIARFNDLNYLDVAHHHARNPHPHDAHYVTAHQGRLRSDSELEALYFEPKSFAAQYSNWLETHVLPELEHIDDDTLLDSMRPVGYVDEVELS